MLNPKSTTAESCDVQTVNRLVGPWDWTCSHVHMACPSLELLHEHAIFLPKKIRMQMLHKSGKDKMKTTVRETFRSSWGRTKVTGQMLYLEASLGRPSCRFLQGWMESSRGGSVD